MAPLDMKPNELEPYWVPFTANRAFKKRPRMFVGAKDKHYFKPDGAKVLDATSGLFCVNAGHCREPIVKAIQEMAARLDYAPAFQYGHPKVFELASRLSLLAPGDLDYAFFSNSGSEAVDTARRGGWGSLVVAVPSHTAVRGTEAGERLLRHAALCGYRYARYLSEVPNGGLHRAEVLPPRGEEQAYRSALGLARAIAAGVVTTRDLANSPPNEATPAWMEDRCRELAASRGLEIEVVQGEELDRRGMGGLAAVGRGAASPPRLVRLRKAGRGRKVALVGKGVTFDTGGISIKPAADMDEMKYDKGGACAVFGAVQVAVDLDLSVDLSAYLPLAENALDSGSYRPGDILRLANGKTVEILNTDAEGRLILGDALAWAVADGAESLVEVSTLTGGCAIALGPHAAGLFTPDDELAAELLAVGEASGDRLWRLPLWPEYLEEMRGTHADLKNTAGRLGSAATAAAFLSQFVGDLHSWAHLDIAGVVSDKGDKGARGATGFGVSLLASWLRRCAATSSSAT